MKATLIVYDIDDANGRSSISRASIEFPFTLVLFIVYLSHIIIQPFFFLYDDDEAIWRSLAHAHFKNIIKVIIILLLIVNSVHTLLNVASLKRVSCMNSKKTCTKKKEYINCYSLDSIILSLLVHLQYSRISSFSYTENQGSVWCESIKMTFERIFFFFYLNIK